MKSIQNAAAIILRYVIWFGLSLLGLWDILQIRIAWVELLIRARVSGWALPALDKWMLLPLGIVWLGAIIWMEDHLTTARTQQIFWQRAARVATVLLVILAITYIVQFLF
jgi:hypothetical protein